MSPSLSTIRAIIAALDDGRAGNPAPALAAREAIKRHTFGTNYQGDSGPAPTAAELSVLVVALCN
jgi:hypothetical protein